jgi:hypothetical protein
VFSFPPLRAENCEDYSLVPDGLRNVLLRRSRSWQRDVYVWRWSIAWLSLKGFLSHVFHVSPWLPRFVDVDACCPCYQDQGSIRRDCSRVAAMAVDRGPELSQRTEIYLLR